ncbi:MAG: SMC-Scp complex subunit ScpB [Mycoplasmataceae bacterium]|jgi:segregation and condensation protein B|nr:SMC-Scp complex subunit ScpB [Mycoplasmataceae bacterium]
MNTKSIIESILYVSGSDGLDISDIKKVINLPADDIRKLIKEMKNSYDTNADTGFTIKTYGSHFYLLTKPENKEFISKLIDVRLKNPLTPAVMETLAIIAYNNPCTGVKVDEIRGSSSDGALKRLESLELIKNIGRSNTPGRPYVYEITQKFFNLFGIKSLTELPKINTEDGNLENVDFFNANRFEDEESK